MTLKELQKREGCTSEVGLKVVFLAIVSRSEGDRIVGAYTDREKAVAAAEHSAKEEREARSNRIGDVVSPLGVGVFVPRVKRLVVA